jgi:hypothetical protein
LSHKSEKQIRIDRRKEFQTAERKEQYELKERRIKRSWKQEKKEQEKREKQEKKEREHREKQERKAREKQEKQERKQHEKEQKTRLRKIKEDSKHSHADIVDASPSADTVKLRTKTGDKVGTRTYRLSTTHGLTPERVTKEKELKEAKKQGESEHHRNIRIKTRQSEITERREQLAKESKKEEEPRSAYREHEHKQKEMIRRRES